MNKNNKNNINKNIDSSIENIVPEFFESNLYFDQKLEQQNNDQQNQTQQALKSNDYNQFKFSDIFNETNHSNLQMTTQKIDNDQPIISQTTLHFKTFNPKIKNVNAQSKNIQNNINSPQLQNMDINLDSQDFPNNLSYSSTFNKGNESINNFQQFTPNSATQNQRTARISKNINIMTRKSVYQKKKNNSLTAEEYNQNILQKQLKEQEDQEKFKKYLFKQKLQYKLNNFLNNLPFKRFQRLNNYHFNQINDKAYFYNQKSSYFLKNSLSKYKTSENIKISLQNRCKNIYNQIWKIQNKIMIKLLDPQDKLPIIIDIIAAFNIIFFFFLYSLHLFFWLNINGHIMFYILITSNLFFATEFIMKMNISFYHQGILVQDRKQIFQKYKQESMFYDIIAFTAQIYNLFDTSQNIQNYIFEILFFCKAKDLSLIIQRLENILYVKGANIHIVQLVKMLFQLIIMCHVIGCLWHFLSKIEEKYLEEDNSWLVQNNLQDLEVKDRYAESFYFAASLIMLIGTKGETFIETVFTTSMLLLTAGVFAYLISTISTILEEINREYNQFKLDIGVLNKFMSHKDLGLDVQSRVRSFIEYQYQASEIRNINNKAHQVLLKVPENLRSQIYSDINSSQLKQFSMITQNFSLKTQQQLTEKMNECSYVTNENIFQQNQNQDLSIFLITKGQVDITCKVDQNKSFVVATFHEGEILGDINFFTGVPYQFSAVCTCFVQANKIERQHFLETIAENIEDLQKYNLIKDQLLFSKISPYHPRKCQICQSYEHQENMCNLLNYRPHIHTVVIKQQFSQPNQRNTEFKRKQNPNDMALNQDLIEYLLKISLKLQEDEDFQEYCDIIENQYEDDYDIDSQYFLDKDFQTFTTKCTNQILEQNRNNLQSFIQSQLDDDVLSQDSSETSISQFQAEQQNVQNNHILSQQQLQSKTNKKNLRKNSKNSSNENPSQEQVSMPNFPQSHSVLSIQQNKYPSVLEPFQSEKKNSHKLENSSKKSSLSHIVMDQDQISQQQLQKFQQFKQQQPSYTKDRTQNNLSSKIQSEFIQSDSTLNKDLFQHPKNNQLKVKQDNFYKKKTVMLNSRQRLISNNTQTYDDSPQIPSNKNIKKANQKFQMKKMTTTCMQSPTLQKIHNKQRKQSLLKNKTQYAKRQSSQFFAENQNQVQFENNYNHQQNQQLIKQQNEQMYQNEQHQFIWKFESSYNWTYYFPQYNLRAQVIKFKLIQQEKQQLQNNNYPKIRKTIKIQKNDNIKNGSLNQVKQQQNLVQTREKSCTQGFMNIKYKN